MKVPCLFSVSSVLALLIPALLLLPAAEVAAVPTNPAPVATTQLDGTSEFVATGHIVGAEDAGALAFRDTAGKHLREYSEEKVDRRELFFERTMPSILETAGAQLKSGAAISINVPVVLVQYADFYASQSVSSFTNMMNQAGYNGTGSFQDCYSTVSYGSLTVTATVVGWYTAPYSRASYQYGTGSLREFHMSRWLARSAIDAAESAGFDWRPYDNDGNGDVDCTFIVHQGPGAECGSTSYVWSHAWFLNPGSSVTRLRWT